MRMTVLGVPDSAGAYCVGVEAAPAALRDAGLIPALRAGGVEVVDGGDLTERRWAPDRGSPFVQNLHEEVAAVRELAAAATPVLAEGDRLLVLGGSCVVALGLCAALAAVEGRPGLVYVDRHLDLNTPQSTDEGSLSWMGMAHALGLPGAAPELVGAAGATPLLRPAELSYLGVDLDATTGWERGQLEALGIPLVPQERLVEQPGLAAEEARSALPRGPFVAHLDVDVLDFLDAPLAENVNGRNSGPTLAQLGRALRVLWADPDCRGLSIGQLDPAHARSDPSVLGRVVDMLRGVVTGGGEQRDR